jgi:hypothetical protein
MNVVICMLYTNFARFRHAKETKRMLIHDHSKGALPIGAAGFYITYCPKGATNNDEQEVPSPRPPASSYRMRSMRHVLPDFHPGKNQEKGNPRKGGALMSSGVNPGRYLQGDVIAGPSPPGVVLPSHYLSKLPKPWRAGSWKSELCLQMKMIIHCTGRRWRG